MVTNLDVLPVFKQIIVSGASILDVGCGGIVYETKKEHDWWNYFDYKKRVGIDIYPPEIEWRKKNYPNDTFIIMDALNIDKYFSENSFDIVHCQNLIEHLEKEKAYELIKKMEIIAIKEVIIGTPKDFRQNPKCLLSRNPFEKHKCVFTQKELENIGYKVFTIDKYFLSYKVFK